MSLLGWLKRRLAICPMREDPAVQQAMATFEKAATENLKAEASLLEATAILAMTTSTVAGTASPPAEPTTDRALRLLLESVVRGRDHA